jgi:NAD(P)-dependent dehydrogenase (short-subunit alcohol dehydrogenase family)
LIVKNLAGGVAVVTGGGSGIGRGLVRAFADAGMRVVVADIEGDAAQLVAKEVDGLPVEVDVSSLESVRNLADDVYRALGRVDVLCNNAGVGVRGPLSSMTAEDWRWTFGVNVDGVSNGLISFLPRMREQKSPAHIVNTGSVAGLVPVPGVGIYSASKAAVVAISEVLRIELKDVRIGVTVICPGAVRTRIREADRNRPAALAATGQEAPEVGLSEDDIDPDELGRRVRQAVIDDDLYVLAVGPRDEAIVKLGQHRLDTLTAIWERP